MLTQDTKRRIDSARDILVGKVPDPKAQVEQITTALIYKFMDDMDTEAEELGGQASFFTNGYEKYAWRKLLDPRLGGHDRLNVYSEALTKMHQNPHLPQLFRDIFKDAFLPYRDPETLNLFLKEINGFTYDHSEKLGDAFEYLLSVMDSQGDAGQFRTPRHIIDFIVKVVDPTKDETVLDPACGTAGFLISGYKHILKQNGVEHPGDQLTPEERTKLMRHFAGYDISPDMVRLSLVNMYLHGFPSPNIHEYDTLTSEERWDETFDVIMANPPFMSPKGGIRPHKRFSLQASRSEVLFVDYIVEHLNLSGRAGVIVPEGIIFQTGTAYKALRKMLVEKYIWAVVSLPGGIFQPYSGVKTSILLMDKSLAKKAESILFVKVENDGFDLGAQRRTIEKNDLTQALAVLQAYKQTLQSGEDPSTILSRSEVSSMVVIAEKSQIAKNGDYNLSGERYRETLVRLHQKWPLVTLDEIVELNPSKPSLKDIDEDTVVSFVPMSDLDIRKAYFTHSQTRKIGEVIKGYTYFAEDDILLAKITPCFENGKIGIAHNLVNKIGFGSTEFIVIRAKETVLPIYLFYLLSQPQLVEHGKTYMTGSAGQQRVPIEFIKSYEIPLPPLEVQQEIVAELEGYQRVIDGARQVVSNYKPSVKIDSDWEMVRVGDLYNVNYGLAISIPQNLDENGIKIISTAETNLDGSLDLSEIRKIKYEKGYDKYFLKPGTLLFNWRNAPKHVGKTVIFNGDTNEKIIYASFLLSLVRRTDQVENMWAWLTLNRLREEGYFMRMSKQAVNQTNFNAELLKNTFISLPPLETQRQIISQVEEEQKLVDANKRLIEIFEQKIKAKIAEVWGEEPQKPVITQIDTVMQAQKVHQTEVRQAELELG